jgi:hypothetical protein
MWYSKTNKQPTTKEMQMTAIDQVDFSTYTETKSNYDPTAEIVILTDTGMELRRSAARLSDDYTRNAVFNRHYAAQLAQLEALISENHEDIDQQIVEDLCQIFNLDLTKEVEVTINVSFTATVSVPLTEIASFDLTPGEIDAELVTLGDYDFELVDCSIDSIDHETS